MVSLSNIANVIGENADLATCCTSNKINTSSFKKPINNQSLTELSTQDFYDANDGFFLFTFNSPQRMLYELQHPNASNIWKYTAREAPYRLTDFEAYNHYAPQLCTLSFVTDNAGSVGSTLRLDCYDVLEMIAHWAYFSGVRSYVDLVFLIYSYGTEYDQSETQGVYIYKIASMVDYDGGGTYNLRIPSSLSTGQYEIRLCCSTATTGMADGECLYYNANSSQLYGTWYALPAYCKQVFAVNSGGGGGGGTSTDYYNYLSIDFYRATYSYSNLTLSDISFTNYIVIGSASNKTFNIYVEYYYDNAATPVKLGTASRTLNEDDMPWATINIHYDGSINTITDANLDDRIAIRAEYSLTVNGATQRKTINTTIERE